MNPADTLPEMITDQPPVPAAPRKTWTAGTITYGTGGLVILFCWLLWGDFAWSMRDRSVPATLQVLLQKFGASDTLNGFICGSLPAILSMVISPIVSYKSDRHRGRWGRRIPFLLVPTPLIVLSLIGLACGPALGLGFHKLLGSHSPGLNSSIVLMLAIFWGLFGLFSTVSNSVYGALINDVVPQPLLGRFFGLFRALSLMAGIVFNFWLFGKVDSLYVWIILGVAALYGFGIPAMCLNIREGQYPTPVPMDEGRTARGWYGATTTYFQESFGNRYYVLFYAATMIASMAPVPFNLFSVFFAKSLGMSTGGIGRCIALTYVVSLMMAYPIGWLVDRFHPLRLTLAVTAAYSLALLGSYFFVHDIRTFSIALVVHGILSGTFATASASLGQRLLPKAEFAQLASAGGIVNSLAYMTVSPAIGMLLDHAHHHYIYTFLLGSGIGALAVGALCLLHSRFIALGGPGNYAPPESPCRAAAR